MDTAMYVTVTYVSVGRGQPLFVMQFVARVFVLFDIVWECCGLHRQRVRGWHVSVTYSTLRGGWHEEVFRKAANSLPAKKCLVKWITRLLVPFAEVVAPNHVKLVWCGLHHLMCRLAATVCVCIVRGVGLK